MFRRPRGEPRPRMQIELGQDMFDVYASGALGENQRLTDLAVSQPVGRQVEDVALSPS